ncbi:RDD family protein [Paenibacillus anaericanus]|uniref:RDD family protein n=1 Tax=Paenibacillus anaericanus TaxID=170367 RepID=A0A3S1BQL4_9BACL|nr:RDD family protein [Paenibacillus anaericanus]RUT47395.1 RDD family protein [Paenibacillus anaericanus]
MYAGFWKRFGAYFLDLIIIYLSVVCFISIWAVFELFLNSIGIEQDQKGSILGTLGVPIYLMIPWVYYAFFESSKMKATIGKQAFKIEVCDLNFHKLSFWRASIRYWSKLLSAIIFLFGFIMAGFTNKKQALHDLISSTLVINKDHSQLNKIQ